MYVKTPVVLLYANAPPPDAAWRRAERPVTARRPTPQDLPALAVTGPAFRRSAASSSAV